MIPQQDIFKRLKRDFITKGADHWNFETSPHEKKRFIQMLAFAKSVPHASILEIGCAEGHFTQLLTSISNDVTAIDVMPIAIQRAKKRVPHVQFHVSTIESFKTRKKYDLIICSEVLYYIVDKRKALDKISRRGKVLLANNYIMFPIYKDGIWAELNLLRFKPMRWKLVMTPGERRVATVGLWQLSA